MPAVLAGDRFLLRQTALTGIVFFCAFGALAGLVGWMPTILADRGFSSLQGGAVISWHSLGALVSMASAGFLLSRFGTWVLAIGLAAGVAVTAILSTALDSFEMIAALMVALGMFLGLAASGGIAFAGNLFPAEIRAAGIGSAMAMGRIGQVVLPTMMGLAFSQQAPAAMVILATSALPAIGALAAVMLRSPGSHHKGS